MTDRLLGDQPDCPDCTWTYELTGMWPSSIVHYSHVTGHGTPTEPKVVYLPWWETHAYDEDDFENDVAGCRS